MISERKTEFIKLWNLGYTYKQMATVLPYSANEIYQYSRVLKLNEEISERKRGAKPKATNALIKEAYTVEGVTDIPTLANRFNLKESSVSQLLVGLGRQGKPTELSKAIAKDLQQFGNKRGSLSEVSRLHNVTRSYVCLINKNLDRYI